MVGYDARKSHLWQDNNHGYYPFKDYIPYQGCRHTLIAGLMLGY